MAKRIHGLLALIVLVTSACANPSRATDPAAGPSGNRTPAAYSPYDVPVYVEANESFHPEDEKRSDTEEPGWRFDH